MKKVMYVLLLVQSTFLMAQKTVVTTYGEKITVNTGANNGVSANGGNVQLGGALIKPTTITTDLTNTLEINSGGSKTKPISAIKLVDGNQDKGYVLTSDASGVATWKPSSMTIINGVVPNNPVTNPPSDFSKQGEYTFYSGCYITLKPGKWRLEFGAWFQVRGASNPAGKFASVFFSKSITNPNDRLTLLSGQKINSILIPDLYTYDATISSDRPGMDKYGTGSVFIDLDKEPGPINIYLWGYYSVDTKFVVNASNIQFSSMNGLAGNYGPYTYLVATNVD